ncbi:hypothetical protein F4775DRAFT_538796 [Biscogniauxia sp. FL1348]|nr:hypothetical protein F4775DRAFT_538796 [Biscogniauxia sp. FL1348]
MAWHNACDDRAVYVRTYIHITTPTYLPIHTHIVMIVDSNMWWVVNNTHSPSASLSLPMFFSLFIIDILTYYSPKRRRRGGGDNIQNTPNPPMVLPPHVLDICVCRRTTMKTGKGKEAKGDHMAHRGGGTSKLTVD